MFCPRRIRSGMLWLVSCSKMVSCSYHISWDWSELNWLCLSVLVRFTTFLCCGWFKLVLFLLLWLTCGCSPSWAGICWVDSKAAVSICLDDSGGYTLVWTAAELHRSTEADVTSSQIAATLRLTLQLTYRYDTRKKKQAHVLHEHTHIHRFFQKSHHHLKRERRNLFCSTH